MSNQDFVIVDGVLEKYTGSDTVVEIPDGVTAIGKEAFKYGPEKDGWNPNSDKIEKIVIPQGVTSIEEYAFYRCENLKEINIPDSITSIEGYAFSRCESLKDILIPDSVKTIGSHAFHDCASLESIKLPKGLKEISIGTFASCKSLVEFEIPEKVKKIGNSAFNGCSSLKKINIPKGIKRLENWVFVRCGFEELDIPANVTIFEISVVSPTLKRLIIRADSAKVSDELFYRKHEKEYKSVPPVEIYCTPVTKAKMPKKFQPACIDIALLDTSPKNAIQEKVNIYKIDDKFLTDQIIGGKDIDDAFDNYALPKNKLFKIMNGAKEIKVKTKFGNSLKKVKEDSLHTFMCYDMYVAAEHLLSKEDVLERINQEDPNHRSDAFMYAAPEIDNKNAPKLGDESAKRRFIIMAYIAEKLLDKAVIEKLAEEMPKKKDGSLAKNKILRIASSGIAQYPCEILEIFAKADGDDSFVVTADFRKFSHEEVALLENDFISRNSNILGLKFE